LETTTRILWLAACLLAGCQNTQTVCGEPELAPATAATATSGGASSQRCVTSAQCPAGLECLSYGSVTTASCETRPLMRCAAPGWSDNATTRQLLTKGFATDALQLSRELDDNEKVPRFAWSPPANANILVCGLFGCPPRFEQAPDGRVFIANADECLLRQAWFSPVPRRIDVRDVKPREGGDDTAPREPAALRFGCWLYSAVKVIGATALERLSADEVPDLRSIVSLCERKTDDGRSCVLTDDPFLGRCLNSACVASCVTSRDCLAPDEGWEMDAGMRDPGLAIQKTAPVTGANGYCYRPTMDGEPECRAPQEP
jgi:hypothetical protein